MATTLDIRSADATPRAGSRWLSLLVGVGGFAALTAVGAKITVPIPWSPVPGTLQPLAVLMAGLFLGARSGAASQVLYVSIGIAGLPVFALPGAGPAYLLGPTAGYLLGFAPAAWVAGRLSRGPGDPGFGRYLVAAVAGAAVLHLAGASWLWALSGDPWAVLASSVLPFILFDLSKAALAAAFRSAWGRRQRA